MNICLQYVWGVIMNIRPGIYICLQYVGGVIMNHVDNIFRVYLYFKFTSLTHCTLFEAFYTIFFFVYDIYLGMRALM